MRILLAITIVLTLVSMGCTSDDPDDDPGIKVRLSEFIPTVAIVTWPTELEPGDEAYVEFGRDDRWYQAPAEIAEGVATATLVGMKASQEYTLRTVEIQGGESVTSDDHSVMTGSIPSGFPDTTLIENFPDQAEDGFILTALLGDPIMAVILDQDGDFVWWHHWNDSGLTETEIARTLISHHDGSVLYHFTGIRNEGQDSAPEMYTVRVSLDGADVDVIEVPLSHHDMAEISDGTVALIETDARQVEDEEVQGDRIVEVKLDGTTTEIWNVWDHVEYEPELADMEAGTGWSHANAIDVHEDEGAYYLSMRNLRTIFKIDRETGEVVWRFGGYLSDFDLLGGATNEFIREHQFDVQGNRITIFDNGNASRTWSRAVEYEIDPDTLEAEMVWEYRPIPSVFCVALGGVQWLPATGNTLVNFSTGGQLDEVSPDGELVRRINLQLGSAFTYAHWQSSLYDT